MDLYAALAASLREMKGWTSSEVYEVVNNAWQLSDKLDDAKQRFRWLFSLWSYHNVRGDLDQGSYLVEQAMEIAEQEQSIPFFMIAYSYQAFDILCRGKLKLAQEQFKKSLSYYDPQHHETYILFSDVDAGVFAHIWDAHTLWLLGYPDQALRQCQKGIDLAQQLNHPFSCAIAWAYLTMLYHFRRETDQVTIYAEACLAVVRQYNIGYYHQWANIFLAWTQAWNSLDQTGLLNLQKALDGFQAIGARLRWPFYLSLLAFFYEKRGEAEAGLEAIDQAFSAAARHHENWWNAELYRLRGNLLLLQGDSALAAEAYQQAIHLAREQESLSLELRATMSLARLWQTQGRSAQAYALLSAVYRQFTEGFNTLDLQEARVLLAALTN